MRGNDAQRRASDELNNENNGTKKPSCNKQEGFKYV